MKCACCSSASGIVGAVGVLVLLVAVVTRLFTVQGIHLLGIQTSPTHLVLGANSLLLIALLLRNPAKTEK